MSLVLDIEQAALLLELDPPFDKRDVQLARRRLAKRWHPDLAPPGKRPQHEKHLQAVNRAADVLERMAEDSRGGRITANAVKVSAAAARKAREEEGRRAYEAEQRARAADADRAKNDPFGSRVPDHSVVHSYSRCLSYPEWGVGSVTGIYFTGGGDDVQQWARVKFQHGVRTVPAGSLEFVEFGVPDPSAERVQRFVTAAQHAIAEGDHALAAQRLVYARRAEPKNPVVLRMLTLAQWQSDDLAAAARTARDWARAERDRPTAQRFLSRIYEAMGAHDIALEAAERAVELAPEDGSAHERVGRLALQLGQLELALERLEAGARLEPSIEGLLDLALARQLSGDLGGEVVAAELATELDPESPAAWSRLAHALARTDRGAECLAACERALALGEDPEVEALRDLVRERLPRELAA